MGRGSHIVRSQMAARHGVLLAAQGTRHGEAGLDRFLTDMRALRPTSAKNHKIRILCINVRVQQGCLAIICHRNSVVSQKEHRGVRVQRRPCLRRRWRQRGNIGTGISDVRCKEPVPCHEALSSPSPTSFASCGRPVGSRLRPTAPPLELSGQGLFCYEPRP